MILDIPKILLSKKANLSMLGIILFSFILPTTIFAAIKEPAFVKTQDKLDRAMEAYEKGYKYYRYGEFEKSEDSLKEALYFEPNLIKAHYWLGKVYREMGLLDDALFHWEEVERLNKLIVDRRNALKIENNEYPDYIQRRKTKEKIKKARDHYEKAMNLLDEGHWDGAEVEMEEAVKAYPGNPKYLLMIARILWDKNEYQASVKFYKDLLSMREVSFENFKEGAERMIKANMDYVLQPLVSKHKFRFEQKPEFIEIASHFIVEEKYLPPVAKAKIIKRVNGQVIINIGMENGLSLSDEFRLKMKAFRPGIVLKDPDNGKDIGREPDKTMANLLLTKVYKNTSWALIQKEFSTGLKVGDLIEFKKTR